MEKERKGRCFYCEDMKAAFEGSETAKNLVTNCGKREHSYWCDKR